MCNYLHIFKKFHFPQFQKIMCTQVNFQNLKVVHLKKFLEEELVNVENGKWKVESGKWKVENGNVHTYYMLNQRVQDSFFHSIHFLIFCLLVFEKLYGLI